MFREILAFLATAGLFATAAVAQQPSPEVIRAAVLRVDRPDLPPISRLELATDDLGFAGARLAIEDNDTTGRFMGQKFEAEEVVVAPETAAEELERLIARGCGFRRASGR